jgi:uncharacterized membrane protein
MGFILALVGLGLVILAFWIVGLIFNFTGWLLHVALVVGLVILAVAAISYFVRSSKSGKK